MAESGSEANILALSCRRARIYRVHWSSAPSTLNIPPTLDPERLQLDVLGDKPDGTYLGGG